MLLLEKKAKVRRQYRELVLTHQIGEDSMSKQKLVKYDKVLNFFNLLMCVRGYQYFQTLAVELFTTVTNKKNGENANSMLIACQQA